MKPRLTDRLRCPRCKGSLELKRIAGDSVDVTEGSLDCNSCGATFPILRGVPRFVAPENYAVSFGLQWNEFRRTQLDSYSGVAISGRRFSDETGWDESTLRGARVLDAGCGAGRFAEIALGMGAEVIAIDYSSAVDAAWQNLSHHERFHALQADIYQLPFAENSLDYVYSLGVLQHTPDVRGALLSLVRFLKSGGWIVVDVYPRSWRAWLHPKYWLRPVTRRIAPARLFSLVRRTAPLLLRISRAAGRVPIVGRGLQRWIPVANYANVYPLSESQLIEWAVLDTFDWFSARYDQPQNAATLREWLLGAGLEEIDVSRRHHLTARARKPKAESSS
jgi:2-polyprenyl-3-methyl-5-hydroxy-6-metoxy-1,4-benzoquinol methylase/uncharacterized protein YbaR (Trm112 family)